ncbi:PilX N-terminal domain-containing pilus assembly protein [Pseudomonas sp. nanlin1]|uniref:pilus assembly PilX family protein n=1 Tax=Pseudomonas sp. nanlin1 TaxID=3040605 RepID=UPI00388E2FC3
MPIGPSALPVARQRGMTLVVCLIFLLLMTLIGVSSMQNATLQEKMAGSVKFRNESFQLAEVALRLGENAVAASSYAIPVCAGTTQCAPPAEATSPDLKAGVNGTSGVNWFATPGTEGVGTGFYGIQKIGTTTDPVILAGSAPITENGVSYTLYRITGVATRGTTRTVLETIYAKQ